MKTACFTGHRPNKLFGYNLSDHKYQVIAQYTREILRPYIEKGFDTFITGGALGFDTVAFFVIESLKKDYPHIKNILAIPFIGQESVWKSSVDIERYNRMKTLATDYIVVDAIPKYSVNGFGPKLNKRNHYMVDNSDLVVALWDGTAGGTGNCVKYAAKQNKKILVINPKDFK